MRAEALVELGLQLRHRAVGCLNAEYGTHAEIRLALERLYLALALNDEPYGNALHASCRQGRLNLAPEHGRKLEAHKAVEHAARLLRVDKVHVKVARMLYGLEYSGLCYLVEHDAVGLLLVKSEHLAEVP